MSMSQLNINVTPEFERDLRALMKSRKLTRKSDAIRYAVHMAVKGEQKRRDFEALLGALNNAAPNESPRFVNEDALWSDR